jgi:molybdopterin/thiamine biosynthesis adenylyltransferase
MIQTPHVVLHAQALHDLISSGQLFGTIICGKETLDAGDVWIISGKTGTEVLVAWHADGRDHPKGFGPDFSQDTLAEVSVAIVLRSADEGESAKDAIEVSEGKYYFVACHRVANCQLTEALPFSFIPMKIDIFDRVRGVFETDVLRDRTVAIVGLGSGGSFIARELVKTGISNLVLLDSDRLEIANICRHEGGLSDIGRLKVNLMRDYLLNRNPTARITCLPMHLNGETLTKMRDAIREADLVICATDNRESRLLVNRACLIENRPTIFGAVFRRAHGGQVLRVIPGLTLCYQCFVSSLPELANSNEISSQSDAARIAYSDRPVAIEPGLSTDILPIAIQMVKLAILELLAGQETTLASLREDLVAPLYLWINRREKGEQYEKWAPLEINTDQRSIMRWYGLYMPRVANCPACGESSETLMEAGAPFSEGF